MRQFSNQSLFLQLIKTFGGIFKSFTLIARVAKCSQGGEMNSRWLERSLRHVSPGLAFLACDWLLSLDPRLLLAADSQREYRRGHQRNVQSNSQIKHEERLQQIDFHLHLETL